MQMARGDTGGGHGDAESAGVGERSECTAPRPVLRIGDAGYDARAVLNAMIDKRPAVIARCLGVADVVASLEGRVRIVWRCPSRAADACS